MPYQCSQTVSIFLLVVATAVATCPRLLGQVELQVVRRIDTSGTISAVSADELTLIDSDGKSQTFRIQTDPLKPISVDRGRVPLNQPAKIEVRGSADKSVLQPGLSIRLMGQVGNGSKTGDVRSIELINEEEAPAGITTDDVPGPREMVDATIVGKISAVGSNRLTLSLPKDRLSPREKLVFDITDVSNITLATNRYAVVKPGDVVNRLAGVEVSTGDLVATSISIDLVNTRDDLNLSIDEQLELKFSDLSTEPQPPREIRSKNFLLRTDVSDREAQVLLEKLENMVELLSQYYGRPLRGTIRCYVVGDLDRWALSAIEPIALNKIQQKSGLTIYRALGNNRDAVVYSGDRHGVVQHESVHAYCFLTFGDTGPLWYSEGMAEMGKFWKPGQRSVEIDPAIIDYLTGAQKQQMSNIISATEIDGEAWRAYAWRWALCHLLANNPNYSDRFKRLGIDMMTRRRGDFQSAFGNLADEISFEYDQFVANFDNGYRVDLCGWDWKTKANPLPASRSAKTTVEAARGWQASGLEVEAGQEYEFESTGNWKLDSDSAEISADGNKQGDGRLVGVVYHRFQLSPVIELGRSGKFTAPANGQLFLRCQESWPRLSDNLGSVEVKFTHARK